VSGACGSNENDAVGAACAEDVAIHIVMTTTTTFQMPAVARVAKAS
jgi:hypothetical protein